MIDREKYITEETKKQKERLKLLERDDYEIWLYEELLSYLVGSEVVPATKQHLEEKSGALEFKEDDRWEIHIKGLAIPSPGSSFTAVIYEINKKQLVNEVYNAIARAKRRRDWLLDKKWWEFWK